MNKENSEDVKNKLFDRLVIVRTYILSEIRRVIKKKKNALLKRLTKYTILTL